MVDKVQDEVTNGVGEITECIGHQNTCNLMFREIYSVINSLRGKPLREQMKTKNFYAVILFLLAAMTTLWILIDPSPSLHTIVSETHKQISNIKNIPSNIRHTKKKMLEVDHKYLDILGFPTSTVKPVLNKSKSAVLKTDPVIVVPVFSSAFEQTKIFLASVKKHLPEKFIVFYDLGLGGKDSLTLKKTCNSTKYNCEVKSFSYNKYPSHVHSQGLGSYVPICIQESLKEYGAVIWSNPHEYFLTKEISTVISIAKEAGIAAWTIKDTTSSITYPKMFTYFEEKPEHYYFHRAIKTSHLIVYNTDFVQSNIMLPWIKCALVEECISPTGSQNSGYCYQPKPRYLYTGCHHYEQSALNVILGKAFSYDNNDYSTTEKIFGIELVNKTEHENTKNTDSWIVGTS
ncbi:uncharacterized protein LOC123527578 [Mercenaria mercenaria]|uniref:uncharacterized protein LOC123527578 n=1 Tax=Mercenaria mercenaria TaxID=6596 RepID=UPI001E1D7855|nr:uncharacterized protein LOC123527578 [Mercenaria mercenaria]